MKMVIYKNKAFNGYCITTWDNYNIPAQDARMIQCLPASEWTVQGIIDYYCQYCGSNPEDFQVFTV